MSSKKNKKKTQIIEIEYEEFEIPADYPIQGSDLDSDTKLEDIEVKGSDFKSNLNEFIGKRIPKDS